MDLLTVYLLALELGESADRAASAHARLEALHAAAQLKPVVRDIAACVRKGALTPDPTWLGDLEWRILEAVGVTWPDYIIDRAGLGPGEYEELEEDVGKRLRTGLADFGPTLPYEHTRDDRALIRHAYGYHDLRVGDLRRMLLSAAAEAAGARPLQARQRTSAALGAAGLWILLLGAYDLFPMDSDVRSMRSVADADLDAAVVRTARRLLRSRDSSSRKDLVASYWRAVDAAGSAARERVGTDRSSAPENEDAPLLEVDGLGVVMLSGKPTSIMLSTGRGDLLTAILKHKPLVLRRPADRTDLDRALLAASGGTLGVAPVRRKSDVRRLTGPARIGPRLQKRLGIPADYMP